MSNLREEIHRKARELAAIEGFMKERVKVVTRSMQDQIDAGATSVGIGTVKIWLNFLNPQLGVTVDGELVVTQERVSPAEELQILPEPVKDKADLLADMIVKRSEVKSGVKTDEQQKGGSSRPHLPREGSEDHHKRPPAKRGNES